MSTDLAAAPFEGPEKLLELWFAPSISALNGQGLRGIDRKLWEEVLHIVKCEILSVIHGSDTDAYLLRHVPVLSVLSLSHLFQRIFPLYLTPSPDPQNLRDNPQSSRSPPHPRYRGNICPSPHCLSLLLFPQIFHVSGSPARSPS